ncbi:hypothetical protein CPB86DRAFT_393352 [Serendipita vermifera]|nr:hypothetical protein CPB86DRAFT_393352 [Serendipita vermifera]
MCRLPRVPFVAHSRARVTIFTTSPSIKVSELAINGHMVKLFLYQVFHLDHKQKRIKLIQAHHSLFIRLLWIRKTMVRDSFSGQGKWRIG